jgi:hypothetical protein
MSPDSPRIVTAPAVTLVDKPFASDLLLRKVRDAIDGRSHAAASC